jgi:hypothetical protein
MIDANTNADTNDKNLELSQQISYLIHNVMLFGGQNLG